MPALKMHLIKLATERHLDFKYCLDNILPHSLCIKKKTKYMGNLKTIQKEHPESIKYMGVRRDASWRNA